MYLFCVLYKKYSHVEKVSRIVASISFFKEDQIPRKNRESMATESSFVKSNNQEENSENEFSLSGISASTGPANDTPLNTAAVTRKRNSNAVIISTADELFEIKELLRRISQDVVDLKHDVQNLREPPHEPAESLASASLKSALKKVTFVETASTIDELIKFKMECRNRTYDVIYNSRGQKTVVSPAHVDESQIIKLSIREKAKIYIPGSPQPLQVIGEIATAVFKIGASIFTIETVLHRERNVPVVLGREFGKQFIVGVNTEHKILTLRDDKGTPCAITYETYLEP